MQTALIVSSATIDRHITRKGSWTMPGGPGLYGGLALRMLGFKVFSVGPVGYKTLSTMALEERLGIRRICCLQPYEGAVFELDYTMGERRTRMTGRIHAVSEDQLSMVPRVDLAIVSPTYGEVPPSIIPLLREKSRLVVVDAQGFHRSGLLLSCKRCADIVHGTGEELSSTGLDAAYLTVETSGYGPISLFVGGERRAYYMGPPGPRLEDPTGAGDVYTSILSLLILHQVYPYDAAWLAAEYTVKLLPIIAETIKREAIKMGVL